MRRAWILLSCVLPCCSPGGTAADAPATARLDDACTVAVRFTESWLRERGGKPVILSDEPESALPRPGAGGWWMPAGGAGEAPSPALLNATLSKDSALARCPALRAYLEHARIPHGAGAVRAAVAGLGAEDSYPAAIFSLTLPSVSADGTEALVATGLMLGPEAGGGELLLLRRRPDGGWRAVSSQPSWIS